MQQDDWDEFIDGVLFAYRTATQKSTQCSPFEVMYCRYYVAHITNKSILETVLILFLCRKAVLPIQQEFLNGEDTSDSLDDDVEKYSKKMAKLKKKLFSKVDHNIKSAQACYKKDYDKKHCHNKVLISLPCEEGEDL